MLEILLQPFKKLPSVRTILVSGCLATSLVYGLTAFQVESTEVERLQGQVRDISAAVDAQINAYGEVLHSLSAVYVTTDYLSWAEFHRFVRGLQLEQRYPGFKRLDYIYWVTNFGRLSRLEQALQNESYWKTPERDYFTIYPAGVREDYFPIYFSEPLTAANKTQIGRDLGVEPVAREAIMSARKTGQVTLMAPLSGQPQNEINLIYPIYKPDSLTDTENHRESALLGIVGIRFQLDEILDKLLSDHTQQHINVAVDQLDKKELARHLYGPEINPSSRFTQSQTIRIGDQNWRISVQPHTVRGGWRSALALFLLLTGLSTTGLLAWNVFLARRAMRAEAEEKFRYVFEAASTPHWLLDEQGLVMDCNQAACDLLGFSSKEELLRHKPTDFCPTQQPMDVILPQDPLKIAFVKENIRFERWQQRRGGELFLVDVSITRVRVARRILFLETWRDLTEQRKTDSKIRHLARYDDLTGLANRSHFQEQLALSIEQAHIASRPLALFFIDLDRFKAINDLLGHQAGDEVLQTFTARLQENLVAGEFAARLGGDEFVMLITAPEAGLSTTRRAEEILALAEEPILLGEEEYPLSASIGISIFPEDGTTPEELLKHADLAMYRAKLLGKHTYQYYAATEAPEETERLPLEMALHRALERNELVLHYQPRLDLNSERIVGMEALVRWRHPERGLIPPVLFIPLAEETGLIQPIGSWVLFTACAQNRVWQMQGLPPLVVSVNLSARQFLQPGLVQEVREALERAQLDPQWLELEITESMVMHNPERAIATLKELKGLGVSLSIDDFGTGYSSLAYLKRFPIDVLKIDRSFVKDLPDDSDDAAITEAVIVMAHALNLKVVAEGVEEVEQGHFLQCHSCDEVQGFYFSKPLPVDDFARWVVDKNAAGQTKELPFE